MAVIVIASAAGSPGVTSTAVGLALTWKRSVILVDADPGAHQAILAGYLRGQISTGKGMQRVAEAHRDRRRLAEAVSDETIPLAADPATDTSPAAGDVLATDTASATDAASITEAAAASTGLSRRLLPGFSKPANATLFDPVWADLADAFVGYEAAGIDVIIDAGRLDPRAGLAQPLIERADLVVLMSRSNLRSVAAARGAALRLREQSRLTGNESNLGLLLLGENEPYGRREIADLLAIPVVSVVASDPQTALVFSDGARRSRKIGRSVLVRSLHRVGDDLTAQVRRRRTRLGLVIDEQDQPMGSPDHAPADRDVAPRTDPSTEPPSAGAGAMVGVVGTDGLVGMDGLVGTDGAGAASKIPAMNAWLSAGTAAGGDDG